MKLKSARIREFKSTWDSGEFNIGKVTCLVGKNEAGKSTLLEALYRLNPIIEEDCNFNPTHDYPRSAVEDYSQDVESGRRQHAEVVTATFEIEPSEIAAIAADFGVGVLKKAEVVTWKSYARDEKGQCVWSIRLSVDERVACTHLIDKFALAPEDRNALKDLATLKSLYEGLGVLATQKAAARSTAETAAAAIEDEAEKAVALEAAKSIAETESAKALKAHLKEFPWKRGLIYAIWDKYLIPNYPKFMYFDEYYQMQ